jgi:hypothetical protein
MSAHILKAFIFSIVFALGISQSSNAANTPKQPLDAGAVVVALKAKGLPIKNVKVYKASDDPNKLLGRPRQYSSKASFHDARYIDDQYADQFQNTIEVFPTVVLASERKSYIDRVTRGVAFLQQYQFQNGNVLLRLDHELTPDEAKEYHDALKLIIAGQ